jgi:dTDP-4-amino-4,6-dideoxygalactose transaminase
MNIPFNQPYLSPAVLKGADILRTLGKNYDACKKEIRKQMGFERLILTPSCTSALEITALTLNIQPGDEVILPSYTYVSTANAFALRGATLVFIDSCKDHPSIDLTAVEKAITSKTKAIVIVHYGGIAIDYALIKALKNKYKIPVIEDAAHCFGARSGNEWIGSAGDFATFSFHETKNTSCGQGGALVVNNKKYWEKANMIACCGTDKLDFIQKKVTSYTWKSIGSNYLLAEPLCAILLVNLRSTAKINKKRLGIWQKYFTAFKSLKKFHTMLKVAGGNGHMFYLVAKNKAERDALLGHLKKNGIEATFHYSPLHLSQFATIHYGAKKLPNAEKFGNGLVRLPLFYELSLAQQDHVIQSVKDFYK